MQAIFKQMIIWSASPLAMYQRFVVFCPEKVAISAVSGIITTNLGKTATHAEIRRAQKDGYITPRYAFLPNRRKAFFLVLIFTV